MGGTHLVVVFFGAAQTMSFHIMLKDFTLSLRF